VNIVDEHGRVLERYRKLKDPRDKFKHVTETLQIHLAKDEPELGLVQDLHAERLRQRAVATNLFPVWDATHNLSLFDLEGSKLIYKPNPAQVMLHNMVEKHKKLNIPLKLLIPKSRRHGVSEGVSKIMYPFIARNNNVKGMVVAQTDPEAEEIFRDKYMFVHSNDPFAPVAQKCSTTMLDFSETGSQIAVRSAGGRKGVGRGSGHIALHLSECAYYPGSARDVSGMIGSLVAGMPKTIVRPDMSVDTVFSMVFAESTGNGQQGWFYEKCMRIHNNEQGRVDGEFGTEEDVMGWQLIFLPWMERWNATLPFRSHKQQLNFVKSLDEEERLLKEKYELSLEQLHWRRDTLLNDIEGTTEDERNRLFKQEHPADIVQCFQPAGGMAFPPEKVDLLHQKAKSPKFVGTLSSPIRLYNEKNNARIYGTPKPKLLPRSDGWYFEQRKPLAGEEYCIGVDLAKGTVAGDYSTAVVFSRTRREFVAYIRAKLGPDDMVEPVRLLARRYNDAWINPEENYGAHLIEELKKCDRRSRLYWRHAKRGSAGTQVLREFGFNTNEYTKKHLVDLTNHRLANEPHIFTCKEMLKEMMTFEQAITESGNVKYPGAPPNSGVFDDVLMGGMLALVADYDMPPPGTTPEDDEKPTAPERGNTRDLPTRLKEMRSAPVDQEDYYDQF
jgi:hypothetical protein